MAKLSWPLPAELEDAFSRPQPEWSDLHKELTTERDMILMLLWQEYKERDPKGHQYSQFCELYRQWHKKLDLSMRQDRAGEKMFVDY